MATEQQQLSPVADTSTTPLHRAVVEQNLEQVNLLLTQKADVNAEDAEQYTVLGLAVGHKGASSASIISALIAAKADINGHTVNSPLHLAVTADNPEAIHLLAEAKADINQPDSKQNRPLHLLRTHKSLATTNALLEHKADIHSKNSYGQTPLQSLLLYNRVSDAENNQRALSLATRLVSAGTTVNARDNGGDTLLHTATESDYPEVAKVLLMEKAEVDSRDQAGASALALACRNGRFGVAKHLLEHKASLNIKNGDDETPLMELLGIDEDDYPDKPKLLALLLRSKAHVNDQDSRAQTVLYQAAQTGDENLVRLLLQAKADPFGIQQEDPTIRNTEVMTMITQAQQQKKQTLAFLGVFHPRIGSQAPIATLKEHSLFERQLPRLVLSLAGSLSTIKIATSLQALEEGEAAELGAAPRI